MNNKYAIRNEHKLVHKSWFSYFTSALLCYFADELWCPSVGVFFIRRKYFKHSKRTPGIPQNITHKNLFKHLLDLTEGGGWPFVLIRKKGLISINMGSSMSFVSQRQGERLNRCFLLIFFIGVSLLEYEQVK